MQVAKGGDVERSFTIITVSKSRLEHIKLSLPHMLAQPCSEVILVDYACPQGTGDYVEAHFPSVRVVRASGDETFSNWKARNLGASLATSDILLFCDADTLLAGDAVKWISANLPGRAFGHFGGSSGGAHREAGAATLAQNQLRGFLAAPAAAFRRLGGYDEVLQGYGSGGDTDMVDCLSLIGMRQFQLDPETIVESVVPHDDEDRTRHHPDPIPLSYCAGLLYRSAKLALLRLKNRAILPLATRQSLYEGARQAALQLGEGETKVGMNVNVAVTAVGMPRQLGYRSAVRKLSFRIEVSVKDELPAIPA